MPFSHPFTRSNIELPTPPQTKTLTIHFKNDRHAYIHFKRRAEDMWSTTVTGELLDDLQKLLDMENPNNAT